MNDIWKELYNAAKNVLKPREVSKIIEAGGVSAAVESLSGKIYVGVCVDMEIEELKQDDAVDSILWIGNPGCYGTYGIAQLLKGDVLPFI